MDDVLGESKAFTHTNDRAIETLHDEVRAKKYESIAWAIDRLSGSVNDAHDALLPLCYHLDE